MKSIYKQRGMTLVEVLIAGIILFISISVISMVSRTKTLNEQKLDNAIKQAYLAEYSQAVIKYHLKFTQERQGVVVISGQQYTWSCQLIDSSPFLMTLSEETDNNNFSGSLLSLFEVTISRENKEKPLYKYTQLIWGRV